MSWTLAFACDHENLWPKAKDTVVFMRRHGNGPGDKIEFLAISTLPPDHTASEHLDLWQRLCGYDPAGYGTSTMYKTKQMENGLYSYAWHCWASCD